MHASGCDLMECKNVVFTPGADFSPRASAMTPRTLKPSATSPAVVRLTLHRSVCVSAARSRSYE